MAEGFLKKDLKPDDGFIIISAGISTVGGLGPTPEAIEVMKEDNIDILLHTSKPFTKALAEAADIILVMSAIHKQFIMDKFPELKDKVYLYKEYADMKEDSLEIVDPIGQPISIYKQVRDEIKRVSLKIIQKLRNVF
jgi:protein-tyrosine phosphatase